MCPHADEPLSEDEFPDEADLVDEEDDVLATIVHCPACGAAMHEDSPQCPSCREWVAPGAAHWRQSPKWYIRGGLWASRAILLNMLIGLALALLAALAIWFGKR